MRTLRKKILLGYGASLVRGDSLLPHLQTHRHPGINEVDKLPVAMFQRPLRR
jgi:hypothetical protein